jgi:putative two-component system response regulator
MKELAGMRLLIVGEKADNVEPLQRVLSQAGYTDILTSSDAAEAAQLCTTHYPELVLLDLGEPGLDDADEPGEEEDLSGYELVEAIRVRLEESENLPVLVIAADASVEARHRALSMGARDFITKPLDETELLLRVRNLLQTSHLQHQLQERNARLLEAVRERTFELEQARLESLRALACLAEYFDDDTQQHTQRVGRTTALIAESLELSDRFVARIRDAAALHDIGKVGVSRRILLKPGRLTPVEEMSMMRHVEIGSRILASARSPVLRLAAEIARTHHERWDGRGYLAGLAGEAIPLSGRITAVADVFDALTHKRPYRPAWEIDQALAEIAGQSGTQFDPRVAEAFAAIEVDILTEDLPPLHATHLLA